MDANGDTVPGQIGERAAVVRMNPLRKMPTQRATGGRSNRCKMQNDAVGCVGNALDVDAIETG